MKHYFAHECYSIDELLEGCNKLSTFMTRARKQADANAIYIDPEVYFGNAFEAFVESIIIQMGTTPAIQIKDYSPVLENDLGVDGFGYGPDGEIHTVQAKARGNSNQSLTANRDHISNFVAHSHAKFGGESKVKYMTIFTTAKDLHVVTQEMYNNEVRVIGNSHLRKMVDNNAMFWSNFRDQLQTCKRDL